MLKNDEILLESFEELNGENNWELKLLNGTNDKNKIKNNVKQKESLCNNENFDGS